MLTQRLGSSTQKDPKFIDALIGAIKRTPGSCDEVWLATDYGFPSMEVHKKSAETLAETAKKFRDIGIRVSLQLSNTIGHGEYMAVRDCSGLCDDPSTEFMVGHDGTVAGYSFCWWGENFRKYVMEELRNYVTLIQPYCVWVDDDLRPRNHAPADYGCFCDNCMKRFNEKYDSNFTREELVNEISFGDIVWRERHVAFLREDLADFTYEMGKVIHECAPDCRMGYQYCGYGGYSGFGFEHIFRAMKDSTGHDPVSRPGGGAYAGHDLQAFIEKGEFIDYQTYMLPDFVVEKRPEIENLPDVVYGKSIGGTCFETSYYMASGANAMSYAMLMNDHKPMEWHEQMLAAFASHCPFWKKLCETSTASEPTGLRVAVSHKAYLRKCDELMGYDPEFFADARPLRYTNLPICYSHDDSLVSLLTADNAASTSDEEVELLMTRPVIASGSAVKVLTERGFDLGVKSEPIDTLKLVAEYTEHPVNGALAGRTCPGRFLVNDQTQLFPTGDGFEPLLRYVSKNGGGDSVERIAEAVVTTSKGAKWMVSGFNLINRIIPTSRRDQLLDAAEYISGRRFAAELITPLQAVLQPRVKDGKTIRVCVTNCTVADSGRMELIIRDPVGKKFICMSQYQETVELTPEYLSENEVRVTIPNVKPWSVAAVFCE